MTHLNIRGLNSQETAKKFISLTATENVKQISPLDSGGWNGTLNGQPLPATDYWFTVDYYEITTTVY
jgi:valyl-tRNA synthetase